ncbi:MAG: sigma-70 family RNA polymerase sigma factor [Candidatus Fermentibacteraceae bacterium]|nr:sigma-70 family RNA polymerase sigma factor [Candidatus Fermentibacteraceae bacterium]
MTGRIITSKRTAKDPRSDSMLMIDLCSGDEDAFSEVIRRFQAPIYSLLIRMLGNEEDAQELLQLTFCRVYRYKERFDPDRKLVNWIFTIASNLAKKEWRRRSKWVSVPLEYVNLASPSKTAPHYDAGRVQLKASIEEAIDRLPHHYREPFILREKEGMSYEDISEILSIKLGTVKSRINRARGYLREYLEDVWEEWK